jgi:ribosomal protein S4
MRKESKFKVYSKSKLLLLDTPIKIIKFKRTKWKYYKSLIKKNFKKSNFFNTFKVSTRLKIWEKKRLFFNSKLILKRSLYQLWDTSIKIKAIRGCVKKLNVLKYDSSNFLNKTVLRFEYNLAILLYRLNFFSNIFESRKYIDAKNVFVNSNYVSHNYNLKKGDVILLSGPKLFSYTHLKTQIKAATYIPFIEIDYYNNLIIIIKDLKELSLEDLCLFTIYHLSLMKLRQIVKP